MSRCSVFSRKLLQAHNVCRCFVRRLWRSFSAAGGSGTCHTHAQAVGRKVRPAHCWSNCCSRCRHSFCSGAANTGTHRHLNQAIVHRYKWQRGMGRGGAEVVLFMMLKIFFKSGPHCHWCYSVWISSLVWDQTTNGSEFCSGTGRVAWPFTACRWYDGTYQTLFNFQRSYKVISHILTVMPTINWHSWQVVGIFCPLL